MRAGAERLLARVVQVFGAAQADHGYLFANARGTRIKLLVHDGFGVWCHTTAVGVEIISNMTRVVHACHLGAMQAFDTGFELVNRAPGFLTTPSCHRRWVKSFVAPLTSCW